MEIYKLFYGESTYEGQQRPYYSFIVKIIKIDESYNKKLSYSVKVSLEKKKSK